VLLDAYETTGDADLLILGLGGLASLMALIRSDGIAHRWFTWWPDRTGFDSRSLDSDMALHAYVRGAGRALAVRHPIVGMVGYASGGPLAAQDLSIAVDTSCLARGSVNLVVRAQRDQEAGIVLPAKQHAEVVINAKRPVVGELAFELVRAKQGILRIVREPPERRSQQRIAGWFELLRTPLEAG
jgi:hypothetical protein